MDRHHDNASRSAPRPFGQRDHRDRRDFGWRSTDGRRPRSRTHSQGPQDGGRRRRSRRADPQVRADHRLRLPADRRGRVGARAQLRESRNSRATIILARMRAARTSLPVEEQPNFQGYRRANGKVGTRNYLAVLTSVNCSATVARLIAKEVERFGHSCRLPERRRRHRARPWHGLRHRRQRRGI